MPFDYVTVAAEAETFIVQLCPNVEVNRPAARQLRRASHVTQQQGGKISPKHFNNNNCGNRTPCL